MSNKEKLPDPTTFYRDFPLYRPFSFENAQVFDVAELIYYSGAIDTYCVGCQRETTLRGIAQIPSEFDRTRWSSLSAMGAMGLQLPKLKDDPYTVTLHCARNPQHRQLFVILIQKHITETEGRRVTVDTIQKIGQYPSLADISMPGSKKYAAILGSERFREFNRALGLAAHDVGIGAYVYLRRIFESLIEEAHTEAKKSTPWDEELYKKNRIPERITMLKAMLPAFLVDNPAMYSLLSKGIHELSEEDCLKHFNALKIGIEIILDDKLEKKQKEKKFAEAKKALGQALNDLSRKP